MTVHLFYNPDLVGQLASCGITGQRRTTPTPADRDVDEIDRLRAGFVLAGRRAQPQSRPVVTNVVAALGSVTITGPRQLPAPAPLALTAASTATTPQTAIECERLRRDNQRLSSEVSRLRAEIERLTANPARATRDAREQVDLDDGARRFALLELD